MSIFLYFLCLSLFVFGLVFAVQGQAIAWEEHIWNDLFCVELEVQI